MKVHALIFDLDGTAIPNDPKGMPSSRVIQTVKEAKKRCHVSVATGRPYEMCSKILEALEIDDICILNGGATLYSMKKKQPVWKLEIDRITLQKIFFKLKDYRKYYVEDEKNSPRMPLDQYAKVINKPIGLSCIFSTTKADGLKMLQIIKTFPGITAHMLHSWKEGTYDIHITHELATKKHALHSLLAHLKVNHEDAMVVGDGNNDLPLFELAGLKIAMANGTDDLKKQADWVAPSVAEDGLAVAIEKYILT